MYQLKTYLDIEHPFEGTKKVPLEDLYQLRWTKEQDRILLEQFQQKKRFEDISKRIGHSHPEIRARLYMLVGLHNPYDASMDSRSRKEIQEATERHNRWEKQGLDILLSADYIMAFKEEAKAHEYIRRKIEDEKLKVNGFYRPGVHIKHPVWGSVTVVKDNADVLKILLSDGTKKTIRK